MKTCTECLELLPYSEFYKHSKRIDGSYILRPKCKTCMKRINRDYLDRNPHIRKNYNKNLIKKKRELIRSLKHDKPCIDCNTSYPFWIMQFDHVRGNKIAKISRIVNTAYSIRILKEEIKKCELVCANCHANRTYLRGDYKHRACQT